MTIKSWKLLYADLPVSLVMVWNVEEQCDLVTHCKTYRQGRVADLLANLVKAGTTYQVQPLNYWFTDTQKELLNRLNFFNSGGLQNHLSAPGPFRCYRRLQPPAYFLDVIYMCILAKFPSSTKSHIPKM